MSLTSCISSSRRKQVADGGAGTAHGVGRFLVGHAEVIDQAAQGGGFLQRVEVFALDVLDQRHGHGDFVRHVPDDRRYALDARDLGGAPAAFAGDQLEFALAVLQRPHDHRLHHALGADRVGQFGQFLLVEYRARLEPARPDDVQRQVPQLVARSALDLLRAWSG